MCWNTKDVQIHLYTYKNWQYLTALAENRQINIEIWCCLIFNTFFKQLSKCSLITSDLSSLYEFPTKKKTCTKVLNHIHIFITIQLLFFSLLTRKIVINYVSAIIIIIAWWWCKIRLFSFLLCCCKCIVCLNSWTKFFECDLQQNSNKAEATYYLFICYFL